MQWAITDQVQEQGAGSRETRGKKDVKEDTDQLAKRHLGANKDVDATEDGDRGKNGEDNEENVVKIAYDHVGDGVCPLLFRLFRHSSSD